MRARSAEARPADQRRPEISGGADKAKDSQTHHVIMRSIGGNRRLILAEH
jgi:hypothetical protein